MNAPDRNRRSELLSQLRFAMATPVDFASQDPQHTAEKVALLTAAATYFNILTVSEHGGRLGPVRQPGLVEQVVAAAFQSFAGTDPHPGPFDKAAMLLRGIVQGHPFHDGNKRTGFLTATYYLARVGYSLKSDIDTEMTVVFCRRLSAGDIRSVDAIARTISSWYEPRREPAAGDQMEGQDEG